MAALGLLRGHAQSSQETAPTPAATAPAPGMLGNGSPKAISNETAAEDPQWRQISIQCSDMAKLAANLKTDVDKSSKDQLSIAVVREAAQIEQLARKLRKESTR